MGILKVKNIDLKFCLLLINQKHFFNFSVSLLSGNGNEVDITERACSEHIAELVNLKWTLTATDTNGIASLKGITLSPTMLDLVTVAPLQWGNL